MNVSPQPGALRELRHRNGLSQQQLATIAGCSMSYVKLLEAGYTPSTGDVLPRIMRTLNDYEPAASGLVVKASTADLGDGHVQE